ncbi:winged helix DNA-binding domain-containing protein [Pseudokineococcus sp. 1T1Z-3]|uniref:winged helix DNA-binding domain-containing protein n=1 Tax=Pseudokineococcus sp. 1T1Z-3 TaxID=3132745 RepID=UPI0030A5866F
MAEAGVLSTGADVVRWRLHAHGLVGEGAGSVLDAVRSLTAVQSQDHLLALWSVARRVPGARLADVQLAMDDGALLRTHVLRPTWHTVVADDLPWLLALTADRVHTANGTPYRRHGLDEELLGRARRLLRRTLGDGASSTREEVSAALAAGGVAVAPGQALAYLLMHAELEGLLVSGPTRGRQQTYALLEDRLDEAAPARTEPQDPVAELVRRHLRGHGPATLQDLRRWSSLPVTRLREGVAALGDQVDVHVVEGRTLLTTGPAPDLTPPRHPEVLLLQSLDELVVGHADSRDLMDVAGLEAAAADVRGLPQAVVLVDGQHAGRWRGRQRSDRLDVEVVLHRPLDDAEVDALEAEAARLADAHGVARGGLDVSSR